MMIKIFIKIIKVFIIISGVRSCTRKSSTNIFQNTAESRIIGGSIAGYEGTEHQVSIRRKEIERHYGFGKGHICGGSVITFTKILTAAHCLYYTDEEEKIVYLRPATDLTTVMGILDLYDQENAVQRDITSYLYHKEFNLNTLVNDIAIMFLKEQIPNEHPIIRPIQFDFRVFEGTKNCKIMGWGITEWTESGSPSRYLLIANVDIVKQDTCIRNYASIGFTLRKGMMCAGNWRGTKDSCKGDSGGPLTCFNKLVGIVSLGHYCGVKNFPGVYTNLSHYVDWIARAKPLYANSPNKSSNIVPNLKLFYLIISFNIIFVVSCLFSL